MVNWTLRMAFVVVLLTGAAFSQFSGGAGMRPPSTTSLSAFDPTQVDLWMNDHEAQRSHNQLESASESVSKLDLKAPGSARREYDTGLQLLMRKNFNGAAEHLEKATSIYPSFVAAHNALGSTYLDLGRNDLARQHFARAVQLDDHLPNPHWNLGRAELALNHYSAAQESIRKASSIAPLDLNLLTALTYVQYLNHDYQGAIETANQVHGRKHEGAAIVHYFAAAASQGQSNLSETRRQLQTMLQEDPKSPAAGQAERMIAQLNDLANQPSAPALEISYAVAPGGKNIAPGELPEQFRKSMQSLKQQQQIAEVESDCETCVVADSSDGLKPGTGVGPSAHPARPSRNYAAWTLHSTVDEVALLFAATDHGRSVRNLTREDVGIRDDRNTPETIVSFRNESELPLRIGLVIDTSSSIIDRFSFEQGAAVNFLRKVVTDENDLAFVVGFSNAVLLAQDFTRDQKEISQGIGELAPAGGTAAWDAVAFAVDKLAGRTETRPVAKILVVISDGEDNSSSVTLKETIESAERDDVIIYTVSTREKNLEDLNRSVGDRALQVLAARTGGAAFFPGSLSSLNRSLAALQQVIRSRYLISYKPASFFRDGRYRTIEVTAQKDGHKLRVYARKGYFAPDN